MDKCFKITDLIQDRLIDSKIDLAFFSNIQQSFFLSQTGKEIFISIIPESKRINENAFAGLLQRDFINESIPKNSEIDPALELIKCKAGLFALIMFDPGGEKDVVFGPGKTFNSLFSQENYGAGFTKGLSIILAYTLCLEECETSSESANAFAIKANEASKKILERIVTGDKKLSDVRKQAEQFDNFGGYYDRTSLSVNTLKTVNTLKNLAPEGSFNCPIEIDRYAGHLIAKVPMNLSEQLLEAYRPEIETHLTDAGKSSLKLPFNIGCVVIAYKDELSKLPEGKLESILKSGQQVSLSFNEPYVVPVRGDNRYSLVASVLMESPDIAKLRKDMELGELYSPGRPLRFTFGAVHNPHLQLDNESMVERMKKSNTLKSWMSFIDSNVPIKV